MVTGFRHTDKYQFVETNLSNMHFKKFKKRKYWLQDLAINDNWWTLESNIYQTDLKYFKQKCCHDKYLQINCMKTNVFEALNFSHILTSCIFLMLILHAFFSRISIVDSFHIQIHTYHPHSKILVNVWLLWPWLTFNYHSYVASR